MRKWLKRLRQKLWLTSHEQWVNGWQFARQTIHDKGEKEGVNYLWDCPRDYGDPFDQGILDYVKDYTRKS